MNKYFKIRISISFAVFLVNIICTAFVFLFSIETTLLKMIGSYVAILLVSIVVFKFPIRFYISSLIFTVFACSLGSCVNLYRHLDFYDIFVHFLSGVLLFDCGRIIIEKLIAKEKMKSNKTVALLFSFLFSCSCAAFWEIYEFLCDILINAEMQGSKANTMGDMIAGTLGAVVSTAVALKLHKRKDTP